MVAESLDWEVCCVSVMFVATGPILIFLGDVSVTRWVWPSMGVGRERVLNLSGWGSPQATGGSKEPGAIQA